MSKVENLYHDTHIYAISMPGEPLPQVEEFKYLRVLFMCERKLECKINRWIGVASAVMWSLYRSVAIQKELS